MLVDTLDIRTNKPLTPMMCEPGAIPRTGEKIVIERGVTWQVIDVAWRGHPDTMRPLLMLAVINGGEYNPAAPVGEFTTVDHA